MFNRVVKQMLDDYSRRSHQKLKEAANSINKHGKNKFYFDFILIFTFSCPFEFLLFVSIPQIEAADELYNYYVSKPILKKLSKNEQS